MSTKAHNIRFYDIADVGSIDPKNQGGTRSQSFGIPWRELPKLFAEDGWHESSVVEGRTATEKDVLDVINFRKELMEEFATAKQAYDLYTYVDKEGDDVTVTAQPLELLEYARKVFLNKDGSFKKPKVVGASHCRRTSSSIVSQYAYAKFHNDMTATLQIPFAEVDISDERKLFEVRARENNIEQGRSRYTEPELLVRACYAVGQFDYGERQLERLGYKRGEQQKYHTCATFHKLYPQLKLMERAMMPVPMVQVGKQMKPAGTYVRGGYWNVKSWDAGDARAFLGTAGAKADTDIKRIEAITKRVAFAYGIEYNDKERLALCLRIQGKVAPTEVIEKYIESLFQEGTADKMLQKTRISEIAVNYSNTAVRELMDAIVSGEEAKVTEAAKSLASATKTVETLEAEVIKLRQENETLTKSVETLKAKLDSLKVKK